MARRFSPRLSIAPDLIRLSTARRLSSLPLMRRQNSSRPWKGPFCSRSVTSRAMNLAPMFLMAVRPKRMLAPATVKSAPDSFTSGGSTLMPSSRHSPMYSATLVEESSTLVSRADMYSRGWWHFMYAVR